jgi:heme-degrading monooxygenase HmoA
MFVYRLRADVNLDEYQAAVFRMYELLTGDPAFGFVSLNTFDAADGQSGLIAEFESAEGVAAWARDPEHLETQERGRTEFYESYWGAEVIKRYEFDRVGGRRLVETSERLPAPSET